MIGAIAPIPMISPVQSTACDRLAGQLKSFLVGTSDEETAAVSDRSSRFSFGARLGLACWTMGWVEPATHDADRKLGIG